MKYLITLLLLSFTLMAFGSSEGGKSHFAHDESMPEPTNAVEAIKMNFTFIDKLNFMGAGCIKCHPAQAKEVYSSIHGQANLLPNDPEGALCLTCHEANHRAKNPKNTRGVDVSPLQDQFGKKHFPAKLACIKCHSDPHVAKFFGFAPHVPSQFEESMHYRKVLLGDKKAPVCFDCHGAHNVLKQDDPMSPISNINERVKMCAKCHQWSNANFAMTFDHKPITLENKPLEYITIFAFKILTLGTFLALGFFMLLDITTTVRNRIFKTAPAHHEEGEKKYVMRLDVAQRWQHFFMLGSVLTLILTGWPLFSPDTSFSRAIIDLFGGASNVAIIHRIAGWVMILDFVYHLFYLANLFRKGHRNHPMLPTPKDVIDLWDMVLFFFGIKKERPKFGQFAFHEKFDYWAVFWGVAMMGFSGIALMFPGVVTRILPSWAIKLAEIIHADESLLAGVVLIIWHFYNVHFKPGIFPMNWAWLTGKMPKHHYEEEHAGHVEELKKQGKWED